MSKRKYNFIKKIDKIEYKNIGKIKKKYDWICSCYTETSKGFKIDIKKMSYKKRQIKAKMFIDATASIGIEENHNLEIWYLLVHVNLCLD